MIDEVMALQLPYRAELRNDLPGLLCHITQAPDRGPLQRHPNCVEMRLPGSNECPRISNACLQGNRVIQSKQCLVTINTYANADLLKLCPDQPCAFKHLCGDGLPLKERRALLPCAFGRLEQAPILLKTAHDDCNIVNDGVSLEMQLSQVTVEFNGIDRLRVAQYASREFVEVVLKRSKSPG